MGFDGAGWGNPAGPFNGQLYEPTGLAFGSGSTALAVTGGRARLNSDNFGGSTDSSRISRGFNVNVAGTVWGSYLGQRVVNSSSEQDVMHTMINQSSTAGHDNNSEFVISLEEFNSNLGGLRGKNTPIFPGYNSGVPISDGQPYLVLFKATNLGGTTGPAELEEWVLTSAQFDSFKQGGMNESELDAAATGSGATQVLQKGSQSYTPSGAYPRLTDADFYLLQAFRGMHGIFDELRLAIGTSGLDDVTPLATAVPETGAFFLLSLTAGAVGVRTAWRRWRA